MTRCAQFCETHPSIPSCVICPDVPANPGEPAHYDPTNVLGWDAGARSYLEVDGDLYLQYDVPSPIAGAICGIAPVALHAVASPAYITHGIFVFSSFGAHFWQTWESGALGSVNVWDAAADANINVRIVRIGAVVYYRVTDGTTTWTNTFATPSYGRQLTLGCLYGAGDRIV